MICGIKQMQLPNISLRAIAVWRRNFLVWRKMAATSILGDMADPMIYLFGLGYGLGTLIPEGHPLLGGSYVAFLATGTVCASTMNAASFEALYSAFSRMHVQKTWEAIMNAPVALDDVVLAELFWAATKAFMSGCAVLVVIALLGLTHSPLALAALPVIFLTGLSFAALGLIMCTLAKDYAFFMYYFTLFVTPMVMLSGVFFPIEQLPQAAQWVSHVLPLSHTVAVVRPLLFGQWPADLWLHLGYLILVAATAFTIAVNLAHKRLLS